MTPPREFTALFPFGGLGAGARGFIHALARLGPDAARFRNLGGIDNDEAACEDFRRLSGGPALCADISKLTPADLIAFAGDRRPDCVFTSPPCKGFSRLLGNKKALEAKYQALNRLVFQGLFLVCETWDSPPPLIILENVPGIVSRGKEILDKAQQLLARYGYLFHRATHDCGEIGGLAQHRKRFLLVARRPEDVPAYVYQPPKKRVRACGEVLSELPIPGGDEGGPLHRLPNLSWLNWVRLALIPAGGDWRDLPGQGEAKTNQRKGRYTNQYRVKGWAAPANVVTGDTDIQEGAQSVADPRIAEAVALKATADGADSFKGRPGLFAVQHWDKPTKSVTGSASVSGSNGAAAVADPRPFDGGRMGVVPWDAPARAVCGESYPSNGSFAVADPRTRAHVNRVTGWDAPIGTVTASPAPSSGAPAVADPRVPALNIGDATRGGALGVIRWDRPAPTVTGNVRPASSNTPGSVADPRIPPELLSPLEPGQERRAAFPKYDVRGWGDPARTVAGSGTNGGFGVADPRVALDHSPRRNTFGVKSWNEPSGAVRSRADIRTGAAAVADPRLGLESSNPDRHWNKYAVQSWQEPASTVIGATRPGSGAPNVADPRLTCEPRSGAYGVLSWEEAAATITGTARIDNSPVAVADPRRPLKGPVPTIIAADGTWHRPLTTLELAALQGLPSTLGGEPLTLAGEKVAAWRERIGNAVPVQAATAIAETLLKALLAAALGTWFLAPSGEPIWVRQDGRREDELGEALSLFGEVAS